MHDNITKTQIFQNIEFDPKGYQRSHKVTFTSKNTYFLEYFFVTRSDKAYVHTKLSHNFNILKL